MIVNYRAVVKVYSIVYSETNLYCLYFDRVYPLIESDSELTQ